MKHIILTNDKDFNLTDIITSFANKADTIKIATAFFSDTEFINSWLGDSKQIDLLVSLRPPTNYYSLKNLHSKLGIKIQFLGNNFHSKFFIFYDKGKPFASIIGSSNFTAGGLHKNIETNAVLTEAKYLLQIDKQFLNLWEQSYSLQPTDLDSFKVVFDNFMKRADESLAEQEALENEILRKRTNWKKKSKVGKEAKMYFAFWRVVNEVKGMVEDISNREYPNVPVYLAIDHFWHWVKVIWARQNNVNQTISSSNVSIPILFQQYCDWDKLNGDYTNKMSETSRTIFAESLSESKIDDLTAEGARLIYSSLHSGGMQTRRFGADKLFVSNNSIEKIRASLKYLLYSNDELDLRIHNLCYNPEYKLSKFKSSGAQELIGWVSPNKYPIRNDKADDALKILGFELK